MICVSLRLDDPSETSNQQIKAGINALENTGAIAIFEGEKL